MFTTVLFDLDGTLLDTLQDLAAAGNHTLTTMHLPTHPVEDYRHMVGGGVPNLIEKILPPENRGEGTKSIALSLFSKYYGEHKNDLTKPYPGILPMLTALKQAGVQMGVLSNKADHFVQEIVEDYFPNTFAITLGLREDFAPKPDPASVYYVMQQLGANPASTLYCGDSDVDMITARNAGLAGCGVLWGFRDKKELSSAGASFLVNDVVELTELIFKGKISSR